MLRYNYKDTGIVAPASKPGVINSGDVVSVSAGSRFGALVRADGTLETFGSGARAKLGHRGADWYGYICTTLLLSLMMLNVVV